MIPALNEERFLGSTLDSVRRSMNGTSHEVIVVDNDSEDGTAAIAARYGAQVIHVPRSTVAAVRNKGVQAACGRIIAFIDADIILTASWASRIPAVLTELDERPSLITGAMCSIPAQSTWIERLWFDPLPMASASHIGSANMLLTRGLFDRVGGFDPQLETGEDYDLCQRAIRSGALVRPDPELKVEHMGFPRTLRAFIRREMWHGRSDFRSLTSVWRSKVALLTIVFVSLHIVGIASFLIDEKNLALGAAGSIILLCAGASFARYWRFGISRIVGNSILFYAYLTGRAISAFGAWQRTATSR